MKKKKDAARPVGQYLMEANDNYPDDTIANCFDFKTGKERFGVSGDTLAVFIGREISSVYDPAATDKANRLEIEWQLRQAAKQLLTLSEHFTATAG